MNLHTALNLIQSHYHREPAFLLQPHLRLDLINANLVLAYPMYTSKRKILIPLPPSGTLARKKQLLLIRIAIALFVIIFIVVQLNVINYGECSGWLRGVIWDHKFIR